MQCNPYVLYMSGGGRIENETVYSFINNGTFVSSDVSELQLRACNDGCYNKFCCYDDEYDHVNFQSFVHHHHNNFKNNIRHSNFNCFGNDGNYNIQTQTAEFCRARVYRFRCLDGERDHQRQPMAAW